MGSKSNFFKYTPPVQEENKKAPELVTVVSRKSDSGAKSQNKKYWLVRETPSEMFKLQEINLKNIPTGPAKLVSSEEFSSDYSLELDYWQKEVRPSMENLEKTVQRGENHRSRGELYSAEMEYSGALEVDEDNVRATFGLGLTYLAKGDIEKAQEIFSKVVQLESAFEVEHKHMFNDFGISMRKMGMYKEALQFYKRGLTLDSEDENLYFNIARTHFESGDWENCFRYLTMCLEKNRGVEEARKFCFYIIEKSTTDDDMLREFGSSEIGTKLRSDILSLLRKMQIAAGVDLDDAIEKTHQIRDRMLVIEEEERHTREIEKDLYNLDENNG
ncbi:tetratricopeptide repeat protein [Desulfovibrio gilichinskyi]|uniref:Tetratricopeptide repeat-containing protein n=1 Tax=Desulfovibrio gilichinskyi TaxID=1519643 RepID=A0A1X7DIC7_9BACT|nr:tetratricopeptide repeat protein [Desulfovibrio gilichinskyi]SMF16061.1 Tetratricopeptide repeat-containing protein [Desulfovibrio gilichinskyi]